MGKPGAAFYYIREDEEAMVREMEMFHTWIEEEEYKIDRDRFGDG